MKGCALLTDLYEFSMANGFRASFDDERRAVFDVFFRTVPDNGSFVIAAGLAQVVDELNNLHFDEDDLAYLKSLGLYQQDFLDYLKNFRFTGTVTAIPEGTPVFAREPLLTVCAPLVQCQLIETWLLNILNHQSLIATKARRIVAAAAGRPVMEFGARRAQGPDAATYGARAAVIGGCSSTSNILAAKKFNLPPAGTMAHSWVQSFDDELTAFRAWARVYPDNASLLVDTYDVLTSGVPNAITVFKELRAAGHQPVGIRIDSGDIAQLAKAARQMLDQAGFEDAKITASNSLDEGVIASLLEQGAPLDNFGVGDKMITSGSAPILSGVYKLAALEVNGQWQPKIKLSNTREKITLPGQKQSYRLFHHGEQTAFADLIALADEELPEDLTVTNVDPLATVNQTTLTNFTAVPLQVPVVGAEALPIETNVLTLQTRAKEHLAKLPESTKRLVNPDRYPVYLSPRLAALQQEMIRAHH